MNEPLNTASEKSGMSPGSLVYVGDLHAAESRISIIDYNHDDLEEQPLQSIDDLLHYKNRETVTWVMVDGLSNTKFIEAIGKLFGIHPLVLEDILNTHQRPKFEEYDDYFYIVMKLLTLDDTPYTVKSEQVSIVTFENFVFTFKETADDLFLPLMKRIRNRKSRFRRLGADYLTYSILDILVDQSFILMDNLADAIDSTEEELTSNPTSDSLGSIQGLKREIIGIRRSATSSRELIASILRSDSDIIHENTRLYFRDVFDHATHVSESIEAQKEAASGLLDIYNSIVSVKLNEVMKVLTIFASIFIPLTFIAGIYGMNFEHMPELKWEWAYPVLWGAFIVIPVALLIYFKKKNWL